MLKDKMCSKMLFWAKISRELYDSTIEKAARSCGISKKEADVLLFFYNNQGFANAKDAVIYRGFSKSYVSKALTLLAKRGFITVSDDSTDKRYQKIVICDRAKPVLAFLRKVQREYFSSIHEGISEEDFLTHIKVMEKMVKNMTDKMKG